MIDRKVAISVKTTFRRASAFMATKDKEGSLKAIFFDAVGTLFYLNGTVGDHYALVGSEVGLDLDARELERAFHAAWKKMPQRAAIDAPRENDDKGWWRELVDLVLDQVAPSLSEFDRDNFFEVAYEHFAEAGVWQLYRSSRRVGAITTALATCSDFKFRRTFALDPRAPRHLEIFPSPFRFQRDRRGQT